MKTKFLTLVLGFVMMVSFASLSSASSEASDSSGGDFRNLDTIYIDAGHSGKTGFDQSFTLSPDSDKNLKIWVKNDGSGSVQFLVEHIDSGVQNTETVSSGGQLTMRAYMPDGSYLYGKFRVYVYTTDGSEMNIKVRARRY